MRHSKSDTLDELRYQIGKYGDFSQSANTLIKNITQLLTQNEYMYTSCQVYTCGKDAFYLMIESGQEHGEQKVPFALNHLSLCAIRGKRQVFKQDDKIKVCIPCFHGHHLIGQLIVYTNHQHIIDTDDLDFLTEVVEFIKGRLIEWGHL